MRTVNSVNKNLNCYTDFGQPLTVSNKVENAQTLKSSNFLLDQERRGDVDYPGDTWQCLETLLLVTCGGARAGKEEGRDTIAIWWVESRNTAKHPTGHSYP